MKNENDITIKDALIVRYLAGEAGPEEAEALHDWLTVRENRLYFEKMQATWNAAHPSKKNRNVNSAEGWKTLGSKLPATALSSSGRTISFGRSRLLYTIAASLLVGVSAALIIFYSLEKDVTVSEVTIAAKDSPNSIRLPDRSNVVLNRGSEISYPKNFDSHSREVRFSGEAFFKITPDEKKPFIIHTAIADIKVVGTSFNVTERNHEVEISVEEGKVLVSTANDSTYLEAGYTGMVRAGIKPILVQDSVNINSWGYATKKFVFKDAPLREVFAHMEKAYPYSIKMANKNIENCKLTATFDNVSAREMLNLIAEALNLTITENDNAFSVEGKGCSGDR